MYIVLKQISKILAYVLLVDREQRGQPAAEPMEESDGARKRCV